MSIQCYHTEEYGTILDCCEHPEASKRRNFERNDLTKTFESKIELIEDWRILLSQEFHKIYVKKAEGPGSSVGMATDYGFDDPGSNPSGDEIFRPSRPALGPTQPPVQRVPGLSRG